MPWKLAKDKQSLLVRCEARRQEWEDSWGVSLFSWLCLPGSLDPTGALHIVYLSDPGGMKGGCHDTSRVCPTQGKQSTGSADTGGFQRDTLFIDLLKICSELKQNNLGCQLQRSTSCLLAEDHRKAAGEIHQRCFLPVTSWLKA